MSESEKHKDNSDVEECIEKLDELLQEQGMDQCLRASLLGSLRESAKDPPPITSEWKAKIEEHAGRIAEGYRKQGWRCSNCGSQELEHGAGSGMSKWKPYVCCAGCGTLLAWG